MTHVVYGLGPASIGVVVSDDAFEFCVKKSLTLCVRAVVDVKIEVLD